MSVVLASASPRRRELLQKAGVAFTVKVSDADEHIDPDTPPHEAVMALARQKARAVAKTCPDDLVIGADTVVVYDGAILGKPSDEADAARMLRMLSGKTHTVYTGVCFVSADKTESFYEQTQVTFYPLTEQEIEAYVATGEPMDKAGAYGIQGRGCTLVQRICGDYFNVVGLPVAAVCRRLREYA
jgi:septum formation protein